MTGVNSSPRDAAASSDGKPGTHTYFVEKPGTHTYFARFTTASDHCAISSCIGSSLLSRKPLLVFPETAQRLSGIQPDRIEPPRRWT